MLIQLNSKIKCIQVFFYAHVIINKKIKNNKLIQTIVQYCTKFHNKKSTVWFYVTNFTNPLQNSI